jgi:xanthine dehydrogenase accessory factor
VLEGTPFRVHVVDERAEWITAPGLPGSVRRHDRPWEEALPELPWSEDDAPFVCVMTHRHDVDEQIVAATLERPARYVGMIGSRTKAAKIRARLEARGVPAAALDRVRCPMGVTGGGKTPREVAISIAAELLQVLHQATPADP